jgi:branched-chain amino acid transport system permease protein
MRRYLSLPVLVGLLVVASALSLPLLTQDAYYVQVASFMGIAVILALSLGLLFGYAGQISFAHAGFYGIGAYTSVILTEKLGVNFLVSIVVAMLLPGVVAFVAGIPAVRLRGHYLAIATLALQLGIYEFFVKAKITEGTVGIFGIERPTLFGLSLEPDAVFYEAIAVSAIATFLFAQWLVQTRFGRGLVAIREDEVAAAAIGINTSLYKVAVFTISAMLAGLAGTLYAYQILFISPASFDLDYSVVILSMVVIGGLGSNVGAILGAVVITIITQILFSAGDLQFLIYGAWIILVILFFPKGLVGIGSSLSTFGRRRLRPRTKSAESQGSQLTETGDKGVRKSDGV